MHIEDHAEDLAKELVGNWKKFGSFAWFNEPEDGDNWTLINISHRDSGLLAQSNADAIKNELEPFTYGKNPDVNFEGHSHWAVGYVNAVAIRVYKRGKITKAFKKYTELHCALENHSVLDESDYHKREYEATLENITNEGPCFSNVNDPPEDWANKVFGWLWDHNQRAIESIDDRGGYPTNEQICEALSALGIEYDKDEDD